MHATDRQPFPWSFMWSWENVVSIPLCLHLDPFLPTTGFGGKISYRRLSSTYGRSWCLWQLKKSSQNSVSCEPSKVARLSNINHSFWFLHDIIPQREQGNSANVDGSVVCFPRCRRHWALLIQRNGCQQHAEGLEERKAFQLHLGS